MVDTNTNGSVSCRQCTIEHGCVEEIMAEQQYHDLRRFMYIWWGLPDVAQNVWIRISKLSLSPYSKKLDFISGPKSNTQAYIYSQLQSIISQYDPIERWQSCMNHSSLKMLWANCSESHHTCLTTHNSCFHSVDWVGGKASWQMILHDLRWSHYRLRSVFVLCVCIVQI